MTHLVVFSSSPMESITMGVCSYVVLVGVFLTKILLVLVGRLLSKTVKPCVVVIMQVSSHFRNIWTSFGIFLYECSYPIAQLAVVS